MKPAGISNPRSWDGLDTCSISSKSAERHKAKMQIRKELADKDT